MLITSRRDSTRRSPGRSRVRCRPRLWQPALGSTSASSVAACDVLGDGRRPAAGLHGAINGPMTTPAPVWRSMPAPTGCAWLKSPAAMAVRPCGAARGAEPGVRTEDQINDRARPFGSPVARSQPSVRRMLSAEAFQPRSSGVILHRGGERGRSRPPAPVVSGDAMTGTEASGPLSALLRSRD